MISLSVTGADIKIFMNRLLKEQCFDMFQIRKAEIKALASFEIDGSLDKDYLLKEEDNAEENFDRRFCYWSELRPFIFNIIRGAQKPKLMKFIFSLNEQEIKNFHPNAKALFLNIQFMDNTLTCTTGTAQISFSMEKELENLWDQYIIQFFRTNEISVSTQ